MGLIKSRPSGIKGRALQSFYKPEFDEVYYYLTGFNDVYCKVYKKDEEDNLLYVRGNCFSSEDIAWIEATHNALNSLVSKNIIGLDLWKKAEAIHNSVLDSLWDFWAGQCNNIKTDIYDILKEEIVDRKCITCSYIKDTERPCEACNNYSLWSINDSQSDRVWALAQKIYNVIEDNKED